MGAGVFHGRVRDGIGCIIRAMTTGPPRRTLYGWWGEDGIGKYVCVVVLGMCRGLVLRAGPVVAGFAVVVDMSSIGRLGPLGCVDCSTSTCGLST